jgi:hypothetical protein
VKRKGTHVLYWFARDRGDREHSVSEPGCGTKCKGKEVVLMKGPFYNGGSSPEHDYVMGSRSRDRTPSTREPRAFHLSSDKSLLDPKERVPVQRSAGEERVTRLRPVRAQQVSLTIVSGV